MKKVFKVFIVLIMMVSLIPNSIKAENESFNILTNEPPMPQISFETYSSSIENAREVWINKVVEINEKAYNQKIDKIYEDEDYYIFEFEYNQDLKDRVLTIGNKEYYDVQIDKISYLKPESKLTKDSSNTKIIELFGWHGFVPYDFWRGRLSQASGVALYLLPSSGSKIVDSILDFLFGSIINALESSTPIEAMSYNKYYYRNKVGCVYSPIIDNWIQSAYVGERRTFAYWWASYENEYGEAIPSDNMEDAISNDSRNPTNYHLREKKPHYDDNEWIIDKAIERQNTAAYYDVFGLADRLY